jgi:hypothetical protein
MASSSAAAGGPIILDDELGDDAALRDALAASLPPSSSSAPAAAASGAKRARSELEESALVHELGATAAKLNALACRARANKSGDDLKETLKRIEKWREWANLKERNPLDVWWRLDDELIDVWLREGKITCATEGCNSVVGAAKWSNALEHLKTTVHKKAVDKHELPQPRIGDSMSKASAASAAVVAAKAPDVAAALYLSSLRYTVPTNIGSMYTDEHLRMATFLQKYKGSVMLSGGGAVARAREEAAKKMTDLMTARMAGNNAAILIDEANSVFGGSGRSRPLAILLACAKIGKPFLLRIVFNVWEGWESDEVGPDGVKFSVAAAAAIREECEKIGFDIKTQGTCLVGDNAVVMDAIAELLGIPRLRCLPHCFALVYAVMTKSFPRVTVATCGLSTFISSGGGTARTDALAKAGVDPRKLKPKATRWGQVLKSNSYLLSKHGEGMVFDVVRGLLKDDDAFKIGKAAKAAKAVAAAAAASAAAAADDAAGADEAADDIDLVDSDGEAEAEKQVVISAIPGDVRKKTSVLTLLKNLHTAFEVVVAKRNFETELQMRIVDYLSSDLQHVLELCSADTNALAGGLVQRINDLRYRLSEAAEDHMQTVVLSRVFSSCSFEATEAEKAVYMKKYVPLIQHAAQSALVQWDKYIPEALTALRHRFLFDPNTKPPPMPAPKGLGYVEADVADFFGAIPGTIDLEVIGHWRLYVSAWDKLPTKLKELGIGPFWNHPDVLRIFPGGSIEGADLSKVATQLRAFAMWHADKPTSNVATERAFGIMRAMEGKQRTHYSDEGVNLELQAKVNSWMVDEIVKPIATSLPALK